MLAATMVLTCLRVTDGRAAHTTAGQQDCLIAPTATCLFVEAERIASSIGNPSRRARTLASIAIEYGNANIENAALLASATLRRARMAASNLERFDSTWPSIARAEAELGNVEEALATAAGITHAGMRNAALSLVADAQAAGNDFIGALLSAARIDDMTSHSTALVDIVRTQAETGDPTAAMAIAEGITLPEHRDRALLAVGRAVARAGDLTQAFEIAEEIHQESRRSWLQARVTAERGDVERALQMAAGINDIIVRRNALGDVALAMAASGDVAAGLRIANSIGNAEHRAVTLLTISEAQTDAGDLNGALRTVATIVELARQREDPGVNAVVIALMPNVVAGVAVQLANAGNAGRAILVATELLPDHERAIAFARIAAEVSRKK